VGGLRIGTFIAAFS